MNNDQNFIEPHLEIALSDLTLGPEAIERMGDHWRLLLEWNRRMNLTSVVDPQRGAWLHYRDSLQLLDLMPAGRAVDIGSGAGFPGLPLAIAEPDRPVTLVEPRRKRCSFLETVVARLSLPNVRVRRARSEDGPDEPYAALLTRATFSNRAALLACKDWVEPGGVVLALRSAEGGPFFQVAKRYELLGEHRLVERLTRGG